MKPAAEIHLAIVINKLSPEQLTGLGEQIHKLPTLPDVTLMYPVIVRDTESVDKMSQEARQAMRTASHDLNYPTRHKVVFGSNPSRLMNEFVQDAMIVGKNGQPAIYVKNFEAPGIEILTKSMPVIDLSNTTNVPEPTKSVENRHSFDRVFYREPQSVKEDKSIVQANKSVDQDNHSPRPK